MEPELFTGVCNGMIPQVEPEMMKSTDESMHKDLGFMYQDIMIPLFKEANEDFSKDYEAAHRNSKKSFLNRIRIVNQGQGFFQKLNYLGTYF